MENTKAILDLCIKVTDPQYKALSEGFKSFYLEKGYLTSKQKDIIVNTLKFKCLNV
jgi:hypothetical protein